MSTTTKENRRKYNLVFDVYMYMYITNGFVVLWLPQT